MRRSTPPPTARHSPRPRTTPPVAGRWGEAPSVPGVPFTNPSGGHRSCNLVPSRITPTRSARGLFVRHHRHAQQRLRLNGAVPRDAADDNYNAFDPLPPRLTPARSATPTSTTPPAPSCCRSSGCGGSSRPSTSTAPAGCRRGTRERRTTAPITSAASSSPATSARPGPRASSMSRRRSRPSPTRKPSRVPISHGAITPGPYNPNANPPTGYYSLEPRGADDPGDVNYIPT